MAFLALLFRLKMQEKLLIVVGVGRANVSREAGEEEIFGDLFPEAAAQAERRFVRECESRPESDKTNL